MGSAPKKTDIRKLVATENPDILFIQETKMELINSRLCYSLWGNSDCDFVFLPSIGRSGGLLSIWSRKHFQLQISFSGEGFLGISGLLAGNISNFINVYSPCNISEKRLLWNNIIDEIRNRGGDSWCVLGDFNSVTDPSEKKGNCPFSSSEIRDFNKFILDAGLLDIPLAGRKYTWYCSNGSATSRLDRFLISGGFLTCWPNVIQKGLPKSVSDHCPVVLFDKEINWGPKPFKFLDCWLDHPDFRNFVRNEWKSFEVHGSASFIIKEKLKMLKNSLRAWNHQCFGHLDSKINSIKKDLEELHIQLEENSWDATDLSRKRSLNSELWQLLKRKECLAAQKSRSKWIKEGDTNSKFFHATLKSRRLRNEIQGFLIGDQWIEDVNSVKEEAHNYFSKQFSCPTWERPSLEGITFKQISAADNHSLTKPFDEAEIKEAVWNCGSSKSPGPDGFNFRFIKEFWDILKAEVCNFIYEFHDTGKFVRGFNPSFVVLLPKNENPLSLKEFRPISLINSMYKILAKILSKRLAVALNSVIADNQSAFLYSRNISEGILISNEIIDEAKRKKKGLCIFQVDFEKAFDSVDWSFIDHMLLKLGFCEQWRLWMKQCISSATISILINGSPTREIQLSRGLRQGDPLSPLLFLVAAEGLSGLISRAIDTQLLEGFEIGNNNVMVSHLQYADDTLLIFTPTENNIWSAKALLHLFALCSGLKINFKKSTFISINVDELFVRTATLSLNCKSGCAPFKHLGIPVGANPRRKQTWLPVIDSFKKKLSSWAFKFLSFGGRVVLLKSVLSSLPIYFFSFYLAPISIIKKLTSMQIKFLWGGDLETNKTAWVKWELICKPIEHGGLGIKDLRKFNLALLGKWRFKLLQNDVSLWCRVFSSKYGRLNSVDACNHQSSNFSNGSTWWQDLGKLTSASSSSGNDWFTMNVTKHVGDGSNTQFWHHLWIGNAPLCQSFPRLYSISVDKLCSIAEMGEHSADGWRWILNWRRNLFEWEFEILHSLNNLLSSAHISHLSEDGWKWKLEESGIYSVRSAFNLLSGIRDQDSDNISSLIWCHKTPYKITTFAWRALMNRIPTTLNLLRRNIISPSAATFCPFCRSEEETTDHLFLQCHFAFKTWMKCYFWWGIASTLPANIKDHFLQHFNLFSSKTRAQVWKMVWFATIWYIWKHRNAIIFRNSSPDADEVFDLIKVNSWLWLKYMVGGISFNYSDWSIDPKSYIFRL